MNATASIVWGLVHMCYHQWWWCNKELYNIINKHITWEDLLVWGSQNKVTPPKNKIIQVSPVPYNEHLCNYYHLPTVTKTVSLWHLVYGPCYVVDVLWSKWHHWQSAIFGHVDAVICAQLFYLFQVEAGIAEHPNLLRHVWPVTSRTWQMETEWVSN